MKRDMDLVRKILLAVEDHEHGFAPDVVIDGYSKEQIGFHVYLMMQGGLIDGAEVTHNNSTSPEAYPTVLTWAGYEFLDNARDEGRWHEARGLLDKVGGASIAVWVGVLTTLVKRKLGLE